MEMGADVIPIPKSKELKTRSLKIVVLRLFCKFMLFHPTLMGCRRFHSTHTLGTSPTSNLVNALSAVLKTGENGDGLTLVARWHMRYLLRRISWRRGECLVMFDVTEHSPCQPLNPLSLEALPGSFFTASTSWPPSCDTRTHMGALDPR